MSGKRTLAAVATMMAALAAAPAEAQRTIRPEDVSVPEGFTIEAAVTGLAAPTMVAFDQDGRMLIAESGYCADPQQCPEGSGGEPKVTRIEEDGSRTVLVDGEDFGDELPVTAVAVHETDVYVVHAGTVSMIEGDELRPVISGLPGNGDHQANQLVFKDGFLYLAIGTVTNSAVVGSDNAVFGWLKRSDLRGLHDIPCEDVTLTGATFTSPNPLADQPDVADPLGGEPTVTTSAYAPFGTEHPEGHVVEGDPKCNGAILRARPDGSDLEVYAWGLRNPYGLEAGPDGELYATMHGFDARGSRPVENAWDCFYRIEEGAWYGYPDYACDVPVTDPRFRPAGQPQPGFLLADHPTDSPPRPIAKFGPHEATNGFAFSPSPEWGAPTTAYVALFGDFTPATGTVDRPVGTEVVRLDTRTGIVSDFLHNDVAGRASQQNAGGLEHPSDVTFGPDGAMYVADWGVAQVSVDGLVLEPDSGVVWKVTAVPGAQGSGGAGPSIWIWAVVLVVLATATWALSRGEARTAPLGRGAWTGAVAGVVMGVFAMAVASPVLNLPWYAPPRVFATLVMGRTALQDILNFDPLSFAVGLVVVVVLTAVLGAAFAAILRARSALRMVVAGLAYGLTVFVLLHYFVLPVIQPLIPQRGFTPEWYAASFAVYGLALGSLLAVLTKDPASRSRGSGGGD
jgi:glucose/arabinose dehydrogenase